MTTDYTELKWSNTRTEHKSGDYLRLNIKYHVTCILSSYVLRFPLIKKTGNSKIFHDLYKLQPQSKCILLVRQHVIRIGERYTNTTNEYWRLRRSRSRQCETNQRRWFICRHTSWIVDAKIRRDLVLWDERRVVLYWYFLNYTNTLRPLGTT